jgi:uncharacterized protein YjiS (DUF1127 family)
MDMSLVSGVRQVSALLEGFIERERAVAELRRLDARALADLGITRAQIRAYVEGTLPRAVAPRPVALVLRVIEGGLGAHARRPRSAARPPLRLAASAG